MARLTTESYTKITLIFLLGVLIIAVMGFGSCSGFAFSFKSNLSQIGGASVGTSGVDSISIDWAAGAVDVIVHDGEEILLTEYADQGLTKAQQMRWDVVGGTLRIDYGNSWGCSTLRGKHLEIYIPKSLAQNIKDLEINGASGKYIVDGITCDTFKAGLASGSLDASNMIIGDLKVELASGNAVVEGMVANEIKAEAASGSIEVRCAKSMPKEIDADMASGTITVFLPENEGFTVKVDKLSGRFESDFALQQNGDSYTYKNGSTSIKADMASGQFIIKKSN